MEWQQDGELAAADRQALVTALLAVECLPHHAELERFSQSPASAGQP